MASRRSLVLAVLFTLHAWVAVAGCKSSQGPANDANAGQGPRIMVPSPAGSAQQQDPAEPPPARPDEVAPILANPLADGGCAPTEPIKSTDPCTSSTDCAPSALCHAPACVDKLKAPVRPDAGAVCTMSLVCKTVDVGRCDCVDGVCALVAR